MKRSHKIALMTSAIVTAITVGAIAIPHPDNANANTHTKTKTARAQNTSHKQSSSHKQSVSQSQTKPDQKPEQKPATPVTNVTPPAQPAPTPQPAPAQPAPQPAPAPAQPAPQRTDGFNLNGRHFDLLSYNDTSGAEAPMNTPFVFRYTPIANYYVADGQSDAGVVARNAGIGSTLVLNGRVLHMTGILSVNQQDPNAFDQMTRVGSTNQADLQTCYDATGINLKVELFN